MQPHTRITAPHRRRRGGWRAKRGWRGGVERTIRQTRILGLNSKLHRYTLQCAQRARESASRNDSFPPRRRGKRDFPVLLAQGRERIRAVASAAPSCSIPARYRRSRHRHCRRRRRRDNRGRKREKAERGRKGDRGGAIGGAQPAAVAGPFVRAGLINDHNRYRSPTERSERN